MTVEPEMLLAFDREVTFPQRHGTLRRVVGPSFPVPEGETLTWFDPLDGEPAVVSQVVAGQLTSFATVVEWPHPDGHVRGRRGFGRPRIRGGVGHGSVDDTLRSFSTDRGMGCIARCHQEKLAERLRDLPEVFAVLAAIRESMVHPLTVDGEVVGVAFSADQCAIAATRRLPAGSVSGQTSIQVIGGTLSLRLPTRFRVWLSSGLRPVGHRDEEWLKRGLPSS